MNIKISFSWWDTNLFQHDHLHFCLLFMHNSYPDQHASLFITLYTLCWVTTRVSWPSPAQNSSILLCGPPYSMRNSYWLNGVLNGLSFLIPSSWFEECTSFIGGPWPWVELPSVTDYYDSSCAILTLCIRLSSGCYVSMVLRVVTYVLLAGVVVGNEMEMRNCLLVEFLDTKPCCVTDT